MFDYDKFKIRISRNTPECDCKISKSNINRKSKKSKKGRPKPTVVKICSSCNGVIAKGVKHVCKKRKKISNIL